jgi:threonine dehydrogenase-like Zn-dependent dehydrogenase
LFAVPFVLCIRWARAAKTAGKRTVAIIGAGVFGILSAAAILSVFVRPPPAPQS